MTHSGEPEQLPRISSGNEEADLILGGGFPARSVNILMGSPGTGKTIFVEQLVFTNASPGRPILYLTTLSEPLPKVLKYLQYFSFYEELKLGSEIVYEDIGPALAAGGLAALVPLLRERILAIGPKMLVIDSFRALHDLDGTMPEMRLMVYELIGLLTAYDTTAFLVGEYNDDHPRALPEFALADGIVEFLRNTLTNRDERYLRVLKLRGSAYLEGLHAFQVSRDGLRIFPRLVTPLVPTDYTLLAERVTSGVFGLDEMLEGGYWRGSTTLLVGPTGSGKTTIGLQFAIEGMRLGQPSLYVNLQENPAQIARNVLALGEDPGTLTERGLHILYESPVELRIDSLIIRIFRALEGNDLQRVVIDSVGDIDGAASDPQRLRDYLYSLKQYFAAKRTTCVLTLETARDEGTDGIRYGYLADNIVQLTLDPTLDPARTLAVIKARASGHELAPKPFRLGGAGVAIGD